MGSGKEDRVTYEELEREVALKSGSRGGGQKLENVVDVVYGCLQIKKYAYLPFGHLEQERRRPRLQEQAIVGPFIAP